MEQEVMTRLYYFAYGSNLHPLRLRARTPSANVLGRAKLRGYRLLFHKRGRDCSAKCDAWWTGQSGDLVQGVVYRIARGNRHNLDRAEDLGRGYDRVLVWVSMGGRRRLVFTYLARPEAIAEELQPFDWYLDYVLQGAWHHGLSGRYLEQVRRETSVRDPNSARRRLNRRMLLSRGAPPYPRR